MLPVAHHVLLLPMASWQGVANGNCIWLQVGVVAVLAYYDECFWLTMPTLGWA